MRFREKILVISWTGKPVTVAFEIVESGEKSTRPDLPQAAFSGIPDKGIGLSKRDCDGGRATIFHEDSLHAWALLQALWKEVDVFAGAFLPLSGGLFHDVLIDLEQICFRHMPHGGHLHGSGAFPLRLDAPFDEKIRFARIERANLNKRWPHHHLIDLMAGRTMHGVEVFGAGGCEQRRKGDQID